LSGYVGFSAEINFLFCTSIHRDFGRKQWGDEGYSREELVAELGSAFLCADLELHQEPREDNAAYIGTWLDVLKNDNRAIFTAAAHAQRAADYLNQKAAAQTAVPATYAA
jgi:antirestriction protein ArdC